jgi:hypothetical protein
MLLLKLTCVLLLVKVLFCVEVAEMGLPNWSVITAGFDTSAWFGNESQTGLPSALVVVTVQTLPALPIVIPTLELNWVLPVV